MFHVEHSADFYPAEILNLEKVFDINYYG